MYKSGLTLAVMLFLSLLTACSLSDIPQAEATAQATPTLTCRDEGLFASCSIFPYPLETTWSTSSGTLANTYRSYAYVTCDSAVSPITVTAEARYEDGTRTLQTLTPCGEL